MHSTVELTPQGRLLARCKVETSEGLRERVSDLTDQAHHCLDRGITLRSGTCLSAIFELLAANDTLRQIYRRNHADAYLERYAQLKAGVVQPEPEADDEPVMETLVISERVEMTLPQGLLGRLATLENSESDSGPHYVNMVRAQEQSARDSEQQSTVTETARYWNVSGRSALLQEDLEYGGASYKAGSHIDFSVSFSFDICLNLPIRIEAGVLTLSTEARRRKDQLSVALPLEADTFSAPITLHQLIGSLTREFSFHGDPAQTQAAQNDLRQRVAELDDPVHAEDLMYGMAHTFCPEGNFYQIDQHAEELKDEQKFWDLAKVVAATGLTEAVEKGDSGRGVF